MLERWTCSSIIFLHESNLERWTCSSIVFLHVQFIGISRLERWTCTSSIVLYENILESHWKMPTEKAQKGQRSASVQCRHLLVKHSGSQRPTNWKAGPGRKLCLLVIKSNRRVDESQSKSTMTTGMELHYQDTLSWLICPTNVAEPSAAISYRMP